MNTTTMIRSGAGLGLGALAFVLSACGSSPVMSGVAVGRLGNNLSMQALRAPQGAEICALHEASAAVPGMAEKSMSDACSKARNSDELWRRAMIVLAAHGDRLAALASGDKPEQAGRLEAAMTGVTGADFATPDGAQETAARDAALQLVGQLESSKNDLEKSIQAAAPQVKTLCDGLEAYLTSQLGTLDETRTDIEKKRSTMADRRCAALDGGRTVCVSQSVLDRVTYATTFGNLAMLESSHLETRDALRAYCTVHRKLEDAASKGSVSKEQTWTDVVGAVQAIPHSRPKSAGGDAAAPEAPKK